MFLLEVESSNVNSVEIQVEGWNPNLRIDPRPIHRSTHFEIPRRFDITCEHRSDGKTIVIICKNYLELRCFDYDESGWRVLLYFRVYDPAEESVPSFLTTTYKYLGIKGEQAPIDTVKVTVDESVKVIGEYAFYGCYDMKVCEMHDNILHIENHAFKGCCSLTSIKLPGGIEEVGHSTFEGCHSLDTIKLSTALKLIGRDAFKNCFSLKAIFIPPSVEKIGDNAFRSCRGIRVLSLPSNITAERIDDRAFLKCDALFRTAQIPQYEISYESDDSSNYGFRSIPDEDELQQMFYRDSFNREQVQQSIIDHCRNQPPLHKTCLDTNVSVQTIHECIRDHGLEITCITDHNGMTPLHILANNPHATTKSIIACYELCKDAFFTRDDDHGNNDGMTPMEYLWKYERLDCLVSLVQALCLHREAHSKTCKHSSKKQRI